MNHTQLDKLLCQHCQDVFKGLYNGSVCLASFKEICRVMCLFQRFP